jgi:hypothetical protein
MLDQKRDICKLQGGDPQESLDLYGRTILEWIFKKQMPIREAGLFGS